MFFILDVLKPRPLKVHQSAHPLPFRAGTYFLGLKHAMSPLRTRWVMSLAWQKLSFLSSACSHSASWNFIFRLCYFSYTGLPLAWNAWRRGGSKWACESGNSSPGLAARLQISTLANLSPRTCLLSPLANSLAFSSRTLSLEPLRHCHGWTVSV